MSALQPMALLPNRAPRGARVHYLPRMTARAISFLASSLLGAGALWACSHASAEVVRWEQISREDIADTGLERIVGIAHGEIDPADARNRLIADIEHAPRNKSARVEFASDVCIVRHKDAAKSNGTAFIEVPNRGGRPLIGNFSLGAAAKSDADQGDRFLLAIGKDGQGFDLAWIGWEFDVARGPDKLGISLPSAQGVTAIVRADMIPSERTAKATFGDLAGYEPSVDAAAAADCTLAVRDGQYGEPQAIDRARWHLAGNEVVFNDASDSQFEPGRIYTLAYRAKSLPIAGIGLAAVRDVASWLKNAPDAPLHAQRTLAFGSSQSGRFLRTFLRDGFNQDEHARKVFDGVWAHIAGAAYLSINERGATPTSLSSFIATRPPFAIDAMLAGDRAFRPKMCFTNTACEYWCGGRSAALVHVAADGSADLATPPDARIYFLAGAQHGAGAFPAKRSSGAQPDNPLETRWSMRALAVAMDAWITNDIAPPASRVPRLDDGTLVPLESLAFPAIPGVRSPVIAQAVMLGAPSGERALPFLVPAVDADGNERAGVRTPESSVPLATYTGWNFRNPATGAERAFAPLLGSRIPLPPDAGARERRRDPRRSIEERYTNETAYLIRARDAASALIADGLLLERDLPHVLARMKAQWTAR